MNVNIIETQNFHKIKYDIKGRLILIKVICLSKISLFLDGFFCLNHNLNKTIYEWLHYKETHFS